MGYFSQRKKHERETLFIKISLIVMTIIYSIIYFAPHSAQFVNTLRSYQFHFYIINLILLVYILYHQKYISAFLAFVLLVVNYTSISQTSNLFVNDKNSSPRSLNLTYSKFYPQDESSLRLSRINTFVDGKIALSPNCSSNFSTVSSYNQDFTLIGVNFSKLSLTEKETAFNNLAKFVSSQDNSVIIAGDFGLVSWSPVFRKFLRQTHLQVKNHIILSNGKEGHRYLSPPYINLLAYDNVGVDTIAFDSKSKIFDFNLRF